MTDQDATPVARCYRHPDMEARIRCARCDRHICPDCMVDAAVGFQCVECARQGARETRPTLRFGGHASRDPRLTTYAIVAVNVVVWLAITLTGGGASPVASTLELTPRGVCSTADGGLYFPSATSAALCSGLPGAVWWPGVATGAVWQVVTNAFTHIDWMHLLVNMLSLVMIGPAIERVLGRARFLAVYLVSALTAAAMVMWFASPETGSVGASGSLFGLMGAMLLLSRRLGGNVRLVLGVLGFNLVYTVLGAGISWQGHLGGLLGGLAVTALLTETDREARQRWFWPGCAAIALMALAAIAVRAVLL